MALATAKASSSSAGGSETMGFCGGTVKRNSTFPVNQARSCSRSAVITDAYGWDVAHEVEVLLP